MESFGERKVLGGISSRVYTLYRGGGGLKIRVHGGRWMDGWKDG